MPYFEEMTEWYSQSSLLLKARPSTTRITSKYTILKPTPSKISKRQSYLSKRASSPTTAQPSTSTNNTTTLNPEDAVTTFKLKTYDPVSGTCLKYQTTKAAEVGRLIGNLGRLGRHMAALPEVMEDLSAAADGGAGTSTPKVKVEKDEDAGMSGLNASVNPAGGQPGGGGKKKKKGKK